jgi:hypothetical protein
MAVGRISGPLLKANLLRNGVDLAFETDLLYLDVNNLRIGVKTNSPTHDLQVLGTTRTTTLEVTDTANIGNITIENDTISSSSDELRLIPFGTNPVVYQRKIVIDDLELENNVIRSTAPDTDIVLSATGIGKVVVSSDLLVNGNIHATGNITADGSIIIGDSDTDSVTFNADIASNIVPDVTETYSLGTALKRWDALYTKEVFSDNLEISGDLVVDGIDLTLRPGNIIYVSTNGDDTKSGTHQNDPYRTLKHALSQATPGTTIYIYSGEYEEILPLTIPSGVSVKGLGIRSVTISPTLATIDQDVFLLNGESTVEDFTIKGFKFNSVNNTGYAFKFASGMTVTSRSPYIKNITVITEGSVTSPADPRGFLSGDAGKGAYLDGSVVNANSKEASCLFHSVTFICPGVDVITATNGVRIEWLNCFTYFANRGFYGLSGSLGFAGQGKTEIRLSNTTGTFNVGDTVTYYSTFPTVLASGVIAKKDADGKIYLSGKVAGLETAASRSGKTIQAFGDAKLSTVIKKFGTASLSLDGTEDYAFIQSNTDFEFGTEDFTIEGWFYRVGADRTQVIYDQRTATPQVVPLIFINSSNQLIYNVNGNARITGSVVSANSWNHFAVSRSGTSTRLFLNGAQVGTTYTDTNNYIQGPVTIGISFNLGVAFEGYIDDLRVSKGIARYTSNFVAPTNILANDNFTVLLLRFDGDDNSTVFVDEAVLPQDIRSSSGGIATKIDLIDYSDFGVEVRSIGSAHVYGNFGAVGDGVGVIMYLIGQNMAYIGTGLRSDNDDTYVIQTNEVVESNGAKIYYSSVDHKGDFRVGDLFYVNQEDGTVTFTTASFNVAPGQALTITDGSNVTYIDGNKIETGNLRFSGNTMESISGPVNLDSASDQINLLNNVLVQGNLEVTGNVTIGGNIVIGDENTDSINFVGGISSNLIPNVDNTYDIGSSTLRWKDTYVNKAYVGDLVLENNQITTNQSGINLLLTANGTGNILIEDLEISNNEIISNSDLVLSSAGTVRINSFKSLKIPVGTTEERPASPEAGMIRFNSTTNRYEGYNGSNWILLDGISDVDGDTRITAEASPGVDDDTLRFFAGGVQVVDITSQGLNAAKLTVDDLELSGNTISNTQGGSLSLQAAQGVVIENFRFSTNSITNVSNGAVTVITSSGDGYVRIGGTGGFVLPAGAAAQRPDNPVIGMVRFDTTEERLEVFNGTTWISVAGSQAGLTVGDVEDLALQYAIALG